MTMMGNAVNQQIQVPPPAESAYISMSNLYNCINGKSKEHYYYIPPPIIEKYVIEGTETDTEHTENKIPEAKKSFKEISNPSQFSSRDAHTFGSSSEAYTAYKFEISTIESEYAFNVEEYGNINEESLQLNGSNKTESKDEISAKHEKFPDSYISKVESNGAEKYTTSTMIESEKQYIQSYYNANELSQWKVY
ncbi:hypothetical protein LOAG_12026 [Loa loa]|nr:hypothetical protein LOAG_12026 [Loa loa]EFO16480.1 hypothetical protein LOAG_12026 [Loa loa]